MRVLYELAAATPALVAGLTVGNVVASLGASEPWPLLTAVAATVLAVYVLNGLIDTLLAHRAARQSGGTS